MSRNLFNMDYNALGVHVFAGGFTVGVDPYFNILAHLESNSYGVKTFKKNFPDVPVYYPEWPASEQFYKQIHFMYSNPPCAPFSTMNNARSEDDPRLAMHERQHDLFFEARPDIYAMESVTGIMRHGKDTLHQFRKDANNAGYHVYYVKHNTKYHGVPQDRERLFFVASRWHISWYEELPTEPIEIEQVLDNVDEPGEWNIYADTGYKHIHLLEHVEPGGRLRELWEKINPESSREKDKYGRVKNRPPFGIVRLRPGQVCNTLYGQMKIHPSEGRPIGINEFKKLSTYPENYKLAGSTRSWGDQLGRAVMPAAGAWLARRVRVALEEKQSFNRHAAEMVDLTNIGRWKTMHRNYQLNMFEDETSTQ